jgi:Potassium-transporting ATPase A subunit
MAGLTVQNFVSAGTGIAVIRGFASRSVRAIGNFYADLVRSVLYVLLPLSIIGALVLVWHAAEPRALRRRHHTRGRRAGAGAGTGRFADRDQAARHQRRWVLQRQLLSPLEPDAALKPARDGLHPAAPGRILLHLGQDGARRPPGLGKLTPLLRLGIATRFAEDFGRPRAFRAALARSISACLASSIAWSSLAVVLRSFEAVSVMPSCLIAQPNAETQPDYSRDRQPPTVASALQTTS